MKFWLLETPAEKIHDDVLHLVNLMKEFTEWVHSQYALREKGLFGYYGAQAEVKYAHISQHLTDVYTVLNKLVLKTKKLPCVEDKLLRVLAEGEVARDFEDVGSNRRYPEQFADLCYDFDQLIEQLFTEEFASLLEQDKKSPYHTHAQFLVHMHKLIDHVLQREERDIAKESEHMSKLYDKIAASE